MSRHYGTPIEPDQEPDTLEPDEEIEIYNALFCEPDLAALERDLERELERMEYLEER